MTNEEWTVFYFAARYNEWIKEGWRSRPVRNRLGHWIRDRVASGPRDEAIVLDEAEGYAVDWITDSTTMVAYVAIGPPERVIFIHKIY